MVSYRGAREREHASRLVSVLERAKETGRGYNEIIIGDIKEHRKMITGIERMSDEEFMRSISGYIFGVASKGWYIVEHNKAIGELKGLGDEIRELRKWKRKDPRIFDYKLKYRYAGFVRELKGLL